MAVVRADLIVLFIILFAVFAVFYFAYWVSPILWIGVIALIGGLCVLAYWIYKQATQSS